MVSEWQGIEDASTNPERTWLYKACSVNTWKPLRKSDCRILSEHQGSDNVLIACGRATANLTDYTIHHNFYKAPERKLCSSIWFQEDPDNGIDLTPIISLNDEKLIEEFYKEAVIQVSDMAECEELSSLLQKEVVLEDDEEHIVCIVKIGSSLSLRKKKKCPVLDADWSVGLQRGYGDYKIQGEEENALGPVGHLSFVIHGIGEAMKQKNSMIPNIEDSIEKMQANMNKEMYNSWKRECQKIEKGQPLPPPPDRIEFIPVEWHDKIHSSSSPLKNDLLSATLDTIPMLRGVINDVMIDLLTYMTPEFSTEVLTCVTDQILESYSAFELVHEHFAAEGSVSLVGHSLGSVIAWDLLSILGDKLNDDSNTNRNSELGRDKPVPSFGLPTVPAGQTTSGGTWGPTLASKLSAIPFIPKFTIFLGSPLGLFLTLRGARPVLDKLRSSEDSTDALVSPFVLPSHSVYNIFHPYDPIAYRIESALLPVGFDESKIPCPENLVLNGEEVRFHVKVKELWREIIKGVSKNDVLSSSFNFPLGGESGRVDFQLQPRVAETEYLYSVAAHSAYWSNVDFQQFFITCAKK